MCQPLVLRRVINGKMLFTTACQHLLTICVATCAIPGDSLACQLLTNHLLTTSALMRYYEWQSLPYRLCAKCCDAWLFMAKSCIVTAHQSPADLSTTSIATGIIINGSLVYQLLAISVARYIMPSGKAFFCQLLINHLLTSAVVGY